MNNDFKKELSRVANLIQNKGKNEDELIPQVKINLAVRAFKQNPLFEYNGTDKDKKKEVDADQKSAEQKYKNYLENYSLESDSDLDTLSSLVYNEIYERRIQKELNRLFNEGKNPSDRLTKQLTEVQNQKLSLKIKLGIDKTEDNRDVVSETELMKKRVFEHIQKHKNEHTIGIGWECDKCGHKDWQEYLLWYKVKDFKAMKHPWFAGRWLFNYEILKDVKEGKIKKDDAWRYMACSSQGGEYKEEYNEYCADYINFCLENWTEITDNIENKN